MAEGGRLRQALARGNRHVPLQDHHRSWSSRPDSACPKDRGPGRLFGAQPDDPARHAGVAAHRLTDGDSRRPTAFSRFVHQSPAEGVDHVRYLLRLAELELIEREGRMVERRIRTAHFPTVKSLDSFDFLAMPSLNKALVLELARGAYIERRENVIALGNSGTGKTHIALGLGLAACQRGLSVGFTTAA